MKYLLLRFLVGAMCAGPASVFAQITLPVEAALPSGTASNPGLRLRTVQAPEGTVIDNTYLRAARQLNGTLRDSEGALVENVTEPGPLPGGLFEVEVVDFTTEPFVAYGQFPDYDQYWPGLLEGGDPNYFAAELLTFLELPAGPIRMGITSGFARTDELDDDGWRLFCGPQPRSFFATPMAESARSAPPFPNTEELNAGNTTEFTLIVPQAGVYPFRLVYWQQRGKSLLEWYVVLNPDTANEERVLLNGDSATAFAFQTTTATTQASGPYVAEASPLPGAAGVPPTQPVEVWLADGATAVDLASIQLTLNGTPVTPQEVTRTGTRIYLVYTPDPARTNPQNRFTPEFKDTEGQTFQETWSFTSRVSNATTAAVTGQWDFNRGDLSATIGTPLAFFSEATRQSTQFGTTRDFGLPDIGGQPALVMAVPGDVSRDIGYVMTHGIAPNGGGTLVNQYTLIMDIYIAPEGPGAAALLQIDSADNTNDGDLFWQGNNFGQGTDGYHGTGQFTAGEWHRIAIAYDMAAVPPVAVKYVDGIKQDEWTANQSLDNPRRALPPTVILFADGDQDERRALYVNCIQIRPGRLSDAQLALLGGPSTHGIPIVLPESSITGQWDFDRGDLSATIGAPLTYFDGPEGLTALSTQYGTPEEFGIEDLPDATPENPARVMAVPGDLTREIGYVMQHRIPPNGGGTLVNQYTLIMDIYVAPEGPGAAALLQIDSLDNTNDGDLFWQGNNFGQGTDGYHGTGQFTAGEWHRVAAAYNLAANPPVVVKYVDGIFQDNWTANQSLDNPRRALPPTVILFADGDQDERRALHANSIQLHHRALSPAELEALGGPQAVGLPLLLPPTEPELPQLHFGRGQSDFLLLWDAAVTGWVLERSTDLRTWTPVPGVTHNYALLNDPGPAFYRLRQVP